MYSKSLEKYYTGQTKDMPNRLKKHNSGYELSTKSGIPWELKYMEEFETRGEAIKREYKLNPKKVANTSHG